MTMANQRVRHNQPFCIVLQNDSTFMFPRPQGLTCTPLYAHAIYEKLTQTGDTDELLEDVDIDDDATTIEMEIERNESNEDLKQAIDGFLRDTDRRENEHEIDLGHGLVDEPVRLIADLGYFYLRSYQGNEDTAPDGAFHNQLRRVLRGQILHFSTSEMLRQLEYRLNQISTADEYLKSMQIPAPLGQSCAEFNMYRYKYSQGDSMYGERYQAVWRRRGIMFPQPVDQDQGRPFYKGLEYLAAAFEIAQISIEVVEQKLDALIAILDFILEPWREILLNDSSLISKRRRAYAAFGLTLEETPSRQDDIQCPPSTNLKRKFDSAFM